MLILHKARTLARDLHRRRVFDRALSRLMQICDPSFDADGILRDLVYGWGNQDWSAEVDYLHDCLGCALRAESSILECGTGLSTVVLGAVAQQRGLHVTSLEHLPEWAERAEHCLASAKIRSVSLIVAPLRDYGTFDWYDVPSGLAAAQAFSLVVCDGPPSSTRGGRYGLAPVMRQSLLPGCVILLDDAERTEEQEIARRWRDELPAHSELVDRRKPYFRFTLSSV